MIIFQGENFKKLLFYHAVNALDHTHRGVRIGLQAGSSCCVNLESEREKFLKEILLRQVDYFMANLQSDRHMNTENKF